MEGWRKLVAIVVLLSLDERLDDFLHDDDHGKPDDEPEDREESGVFVEMPEMAVMGVDEEVEDHQYQKYGKEDHPPRLRVVSPFGQEIA
jgi:hypothetical protein